MTSSTKACQYFKQSLFDKEDFTYTFELVPGAAAPRLISRDLVKRMKKGAVLVDVAIDQGGCAETSRATTHADPTYVVDGVVHYCVANMPGAVPRTSTFALTNATLPFVEQISSLGVEEAVRTEPALAFGANVWRGDIVHEGVAAIRVGRTQPAASEVVDADLDSEWRRRDLHLRGEQ